MQDSAEAWAYASSKGATRIIGPNCPGIITPGESSSASPRPITGKGPIGLVDRAP